MIWEEIAQSARILIVDDEPVNVRLLERVLAKAEYSHVHSTNNPLEALPLCKEFRPDLILLDLNMPDIDGYDILEQLPLVNGPDTFLPVLVLTGDATEVAKERALTLGAHDFLSKPFSVSEALLRVRNLLRTRFLHRRMESENERLEKRVRERTEAYEAAQVETLERLAQAAEFRDDDTGQHTRRVGQLSARLAAALGLPPVEVELIRRAAPLHDVGKIAIPDAILLKPGRLTPEERRTMETHTVSGAEILSRGNSALVRMAEEIALCHHERWDGGGYPNGLGGEEIPRVARIVAVVDFYDALSHDRPYRTAWPREEVCAEIGRGAGTHFDPGIAETFLRLV